MKTFVDISSEYLFYALLEKYNGMCFSILLCFSDKKYYCF